MKGWNLPIRYWSQRRETEFTQRKQLPSQSISSFVEISRVHGDKSPDLHIVPRQKLHLRHPHALTPSRESLRCTLCMLWQRDKTCICRWSNPVLAVISHLLNDRSYFFIFMYIPYFFIVYHLFVPTNTHTYIKILNYCYKTLLQASVLLHHLQGALILLLLKFSNIKIIKIT